MAQGREIADMAQGSVERERLDRLFASQPSRQLGEFGRPQLRLVSLFGVTMTSRIHGRSVPP